MPHGLRLDRAPASWEQPPRKTVLKLDQDLVLVVRCDQGPLFLDPPPPFGLKAGKQFEKVPRTFSSENVVLDLGNRQPQEMRKLRFHHGRAAEISREVARLTAPIILLQCARLGGISDPGGPDTTR